MNWYIAIDKSAIPYRFEMKLSGVTWGFEINYNDEHDFFTADLLQVNEIIASEKIIYNRPLFQDEIQNVKILPLDLSGNADRVGWEELGKSVLLYLEGADYE